MLIIHPNGNIINTDSVRQWLIGNKSEPSSHGEYTTYYLFAEFTNGDCEPIHRSGSKSECEHLLNKIVVEHLRPQSVPFPMQEILDQIREK